MTKVIDGKKISEGIISKLKTKKPKKLGVVLIGENKASLSFIKQKEIYCKKAGIDFELFKFSPKTKGIKEKIKEISERKDISGLIIQLPLPKGMKEEEILSLIPQEKDVDVLSSSSLGEFYQGNFNILPPTVRAVSFVLKENKVKIKGKNVVLVGSGNLVGKPLSIWFSKKGATVILINEFTKEISFFTKKADILISGAGKPNLIKGNILKKGVVLIDFGFKNGKGDLDFKSASKKASLISPVPGGMGPLTVAMVLKNLVDYGKR
jgi:methylenetetrahydrofolate dehydrogenase (NADP+)/methenyltetrahydrofolate cyclohydrolase